MIEIISDKGCSFATLQDFFKWLMKKENIENIQFNGTEEANNVYAFVKYYKVTKKQCEQALVDANETFKKDKDNDLVKESIQELIRVNSDGKFLRAMLIALGYTTFAKNKDNAYLPLAAAYETFQTAILIHDDIIDNATLRRGKETIPVAYKTRFDKYKNKAKDTFESKKNHIADSLGICVGDLGFYLANKIIIDNYKDNAKLADVLSLYNKIVINTIKGEIIDVKLPFDAEYLGENVTNEKSVMEIYHLKTSWYSVVGPYLLGMTLAGANKDVMEKMENILNNLGIVFQIKDDLLGIYGVEEELGKSASSDISEFKQTILYAYLVEKAPEYLDKINKYYGKEELKLEELNTVKEIFEKSGAKAYAENTMNKLFANAINSLKDENILDKECKEILLGLVEYLRLRTK